VSGGGSAVGLVEVRGLTGAIGAADVMAKAAPVRIGSPVLIGDGLVTIVCRGDIAAVAEAVAAGSDAAGRLGTLIGGRTFGRLYAEVDRAFRFEGREPSPD
jgi:ethanolamine utilization protein EutM